MVEILTLVSEEEDLGKRLDSYIAHHATGTSRSKVGVLIRGGKVLVDGKSAKASHLLRPGQTVTVELSALTELRPEVTRAEKIALDILYEDSSVIAINKPAGMVVHPAKGHWSGTLTAGLLFHFQELSGLAGDSRPGIVHRLDRDTTGVILVAKNDQAHAHLAAQFESRTIEKKYVCLVCPPPDRDRDWIDVAIGKHPYQREKMAAEPMGVKCKSAATFFEVVDRQGLVGLLEVSPKTGRTHQIRVHLAHLGCAVLADRQYSNRSNVTKNWLLGKRQDVCDESDVLISRHALHARSISFAHPETEESITIEAPLPSDFQQTWEFACQHPTPKRRRN